MGGGGKPDEEGFQKLQIATAQKLDPETEKRQRHLFSEAERFAATGPFQQQYGTSPGMTDMSQAGQRFLTDSILGQGQYDAQNLGFQGWERPAGADTRDPFQYQPLATNVIGGGGGGDDSSIDRPPPSSGPGGRHPGTLDDGDPGMGTGADMSQMPSSRGQPPVISTLPITQQRPDPYAGTGGPGLEDIDVMEARPPVTPAIVPPISDPWRPPSGAPPAVTQEAPADDLREPSYAPLPPQLGFQPPMGQDFPTPPAMQDTARQITPQDREIFGHPAPMRVIGQAQQRPQAERSPLESYQQDKLQQAMLAPDLPGGVGIGETQEAATAMRGLLAQQAPQDVRAQTVSGPRVRRTDVQTQEDIAAQDVAGPAGFDVDEFGGASFLGGRSVEDYLQPAGVEAQVAQAQQDYETALAQEEARQASAGAFGSRGSVEEAGLRGAQQRNIAQIRGAGFERAAQMMEADTARQQQAGMQQQQLTQQQRAQTQQLGAQADLATAQNRLSAEQANLQAAMASGDRQAIVDAQRNIGQAEMGLQAAQGNQQARLQAAELSQRGLQQYGQQQMDAARGLAGTGDQLQQQTFAAGGQLAGMGADQERLRQMQQAFDYEQWLRMQDPAGLQLVQSMMPGGRQEQWQRRPSTAGQIFGGLLSAGGVASKFINPASDIRVKENIAYMGDENGFRTYGFNYIGSDQRYKGVMAQEVMQTRPDAVDMDMNGVYRVDYGAIDVQMEAI